MMNESPMFNTIMSDETCDLFVHKMYNIFDTCFAGFTKENSTIDGHDYGINQNEERQNGYIYKTRYRADGKFESFDEGYKKLKGHYNAFCNKMEELNPYKPGNADKYYNGQLYELFRSYHWYIRTDTDKKVALDINIHSYMQPYSREVVVYIHMNRTDIVKNN